MQVDLQEGLPGSSPSTLTVAQLSAVPSVGTVTTGAHYSASEGIGAVPLAAPFDTSVGNGPIAWTTGYNVTVDAQEAVDGTLGGNIALAVDVDAAIPALSAAIADTLSEAKSAYPACPSTCPNPTLMQLMAAFDSNGDGVYTPEEVATSGYINDLGFEEDLDLLASYKDEGLVFWPSHDHVYDSRGNSYAFAASQITLE